MSLSGNLRSPSLVAGNFTGRSSCLAPLLASRVACAIAATLVGCSPAGRPRPVAVPSVDPAAAAELAIKEYDRDGDGRLNANELKACPGILAAKGRYDTDKDQTISNEEIAAMLKSMFDSGVGLIGVHCTVSRGSQPLSGATVRFVPEAFLGDAIKPAVGTTDASGTAAVAIPDDQLPADQHGLQSVQPGVYRIEVEHASIRRPAPLRGCEINPAVRGSTDVTIRLK